MTVLYLPGNPSVSWALGYEPGSNLLVVGLLLIPVLGLSTLMTFILLPAEVLDPTRLLQFFAPRLSREPRKESSPAPPKRRKKKR